MRLTVKGDKTHPMRLSELNQGTYTCIVGTCEYRTILLVSRHGNAIGIDEDENTIGRSWITGTPDYDSTELFDVKRVTIDAISVSEV